jgi:Zn finger protein HypA/HybF involved in hydrogenase expression
MFRRNKVSKDAFQLEVDETQLFLGDELRGKVRIASKENFEVEKVTVNLRCEERKAKASATLYECELELSDGFEVKSGKAKELPFTIRLPITERETFHSIDQSIEWLVDAFIKIDGVRKPIVADGGGFLLVGKRREPINEIATKEIVREVVLIPCAYCSGLMPQTSVFCPNCGARRKG